MTVAEMNNTYDHSFRNGITNNEPIVSLLWAGQD
jgi:hypothetical protein